MMSQFASDLEFMAGRTTTTWLQMVPGVVTQQYKYSNLHDNVFRVGTLSKLNQLAADVRFWLIATKTVILTGR